VDSGRDVRSPRGTCESRTADDSAFDWKRCASYILWQQSALAVDKGPPQVHGDLPCRCAGTRLHQVRSLAVQLSLLSDGRSVPPWSSYLSPSSLITKLHSLPPVSFPYSRTLFRNSHARHSYSLLYLNVHLRHDHQTLAALLSDDRRECNIDPRIGLGDWQPRGFSPAASRAFISVAASR
jgi:hypothetical protein